MGGIDKNELKMIKMSSRIITKCIKHELGNANAKNILKICNTMINKTSDTSLKKCKKTLFSFIFFHAPHFKALKLIVCLEDVFV